MKILITGASGKIGTKLLKALGGNCDLVVLTRDSKTQFKNAKNYWVDLNDTSRLERIFRKEKPNIIIHLAAVLPQVCNEDQKMAQKINVDATKLLAQLAAKNGADKFIFASTAGIYRQTELLPTTEVNNIEPLSIYAQTKYDAERELELTSKKTSTQYIVLRIFNVYGDNFTDSLIYKLVHSSKNNPVNLCGPDNYYRDYIHIDDVIKAFKLVLAKDHFANSFTLMNIASGKVTNNSELVSKLESHGYNPVFLAKECDESISWANIDVARDELCFDPKPDLRVS